MTSEIPNPLMVTPFDSRSQLIQKQSTSCEERLFSALCRIEGITVTIYDALQFDESKTKICQMAFVQQTSAINF